MPLDVPIANRMPMSQRERDVLKVLLLRRPILPTAGRTMPPGASPSGRGFPLAEALQAEEVTTPQQRTFLPSPKCGHFSCCLIA